MTVVTNMHKPFFIFKTYVCHGYEGVMPVLCTPLQVKCYQLCLYRSLFYLLIYVLTALKTSLKTTETATLEMDMKSIKVFRDNVWEHYSCRQSNTFSSQYVLRLAGINLEHIYSQQSICYVN